MREKRWEAHQWLGERRIMVLLWCVPMLFVHNLKCLYLTHAIALLHITSVMVTLHCKALFYKCIHHIVKNYFCLFINLSIANLFICSLKDSNVILAQHRTLNDFVSHHGIKSFCAWFVVFFWKTTSFIFAMEQWMFPIAEYFFQEIFFFIKHSFPREACFSFWLRISESCINQRACLFSLTRKCGFPS